MGLFDKLKQGLTKTTQLLNTDIRDLFKSQGRLVDDSFQNELFEWLIKTDMGVDAAQEIADDICEVFRARVIETSEAVEGIKQNAQGHSWPSRPIRSASPPAGRRSSWWPASTAAARPRRSPS